MIHLHHDVADPVEEVSVMGDHQKRAARTAKVAFKKLDCVDVKVVRRLVHDEEFRLGGKHLCECDPLYFSSGKFLHPLVRIRKIEAGQELDHPALIFPQMFLVESGGESGA